MKRFQQFLIEKTMSASEAMQILGLKPGFTADDLKKAYRAASMQNHPDKGGSTEKMQQVNVANDVLGRLAASGNTGTSYGTDASREFHEQRRQQYARIAMDMITSHLHPAKFLDHFNKVFGEPFTGEVREPYSLSMSVNHMLRWENASKSIVLEMRVHADFSPLYRPTLAGINGHNLNMVIETTILANRRQVKLTQRSYTFSADPDYLNNPQKLFPKAKLLAQIDKSASRKMSKRDVVLTLTKEFGGTVDTYSGNLWARVPVGDMSVALYRSTFLGSSSWSFQGVYDKKSLRKAAEVPVNFFMEDEASMGWIYDFFKHVQKSPPPSATALAEVIAHVCTMYKDAKKQS